MTESRGNLHQSIAGLHTAYDQEVGVGETAVVGSAASARTVVTAASARTVVTAASATAVASATAGAASVFRSTTADDTRRAPTVQETNATAIGIGLCAVSQETAAPTAATIAVVVTRGAAIPIWTHHSQSIPDTTRSDHSCRWYLPGRDRPGRCPVTLRRLRRRLRAAR